MNRSIRDFCKQYHFTRRGWNHMRTVADQLAKDLRKDRDRGKHMVEPITHDGCLNCNNYSHEKFMCPLALECLSDEDMYSRYEPRRLVGERG